MSEVESINKRIDRYIDINEGDHKEFRKLFGLIQEDLVEIKVHAKNSSEQSTKTNNSVARNVEKIATLETSFAINSLSLEQLNKNHEELKNILSEKDKTTKERIFSTVMKLAIPAITIIAGYMNLVDKVGGLSESVDELKNNYDDVSKLSSEFYDLKNDLKNGKYILEVKQ